MNALALVANALALYATEAPATIVLDGCSTDSSERAALIEAMPTNDPRTLASIADLLKAPDGATCLMESWTLVKVFHAQSGDELIARTLVAGLGSDEAHIAARSARLVRVLGVGDPSAFTWIVGRPDMTTSGWHALKSDLATMPASQSKAALASALDGVAPATAKRDAR